MSDENPPPQVDDPSDAPAPDPTPAGHAAPAAPSRLAALARPVPMLSLALVASLLLSVFLLIRGPGDDSGSGKRTELLSVAETYALNLSSYDYTRLDQDFARVLDTATGEFKDQYQVAKEALRDAIVKGKGKATGTVLAKAVVSLDGDRAEVILFVDQTVTNVNTAQPRIDRLRMRMGLEKQSGRWLISKLDLV